MISTTYNNAFFFVYTHYMGDYPSKNSLVAWQELIPLNRLINEYRFYETFYVFIILL